ncbi:Hexaprenyldihydroxybenzoate methyltransferase, mitochondrial, partial [Coemansia sp. RSA 1933]
MNRPRMQFLRETLADLYHRQSRSDSVEWMQGMGAVDVGCGGGLASEAMARMGLHVLGIDAAAENVEIARLHQQKDHALTQGSLLRYAQTTAEQLVLTDRKFDVVVSLEVIEHVTDPVAFCKSLVDLAKPGALIVLSTMNRTPVSFIVDVLVPEYLMGWVPRGTHDHSKFMAPEELARIFQSLGAQALDTRGLIMDPL